MLWRNLGIVVLSHVSLPVLHSTDYQNQFFSKNFLDFKSDAIEKMGIIKP